MNHLEILARLIADLYQQMAELNALVEQKDAEIAALTRAIQTMEGPAEVKPG